MEKDIAIHERSKVSLVTRGHFHNCSEGYNTLAPPMIVRSTTQGYTQS